MSTIYISQGQGFPFIKSVEDMPLSISVDAPWSIQHVMA